MDFNLDENAQDLRNLAAELLGRETGTERLEAHEACGAPYDGALWKALAQAGLLGACLPEEAGGAGMGPVELAVILREAGAHVAPVPLFASLTAAATLAAHGRTELLSAAGETIITGALREPGRPVTATPSGTGFTLDGVKTFVAYAEQAEHILVTAGDDLFVVAREALELSPQPAATGEPMSRIGLDGVQVPADARIEGAARTLAHFMTAGAVATAAGVLDGALTLTTEHVKTREQFDRPLAEFQAVTMQVGDVYIAKRALDVAVWAGVWRLAEDRPDTGEVLAVAALNVCEDALKALYTCQHLHGGLGLDVTYPLHRYFAWGKHYAHLLGGAEAQLDTIGGLVCSSI